MLDPEFGEEGQLPALPDTVPVGVPSTLARRRPDIRKSEAALHAATAEVGVSVASLFPDISLAGSYGLRNLGTRYLLDWQSHFYSFGPTVSVPIFHGGALVASVRLSRALAVELDAYRHGVISCISALTAQLQAVQARQQLEEGMLTQSTDLVRLYKAMGGGWEDAPVSR